MSLSLNTNISALSAQRNLRMNNSAAASSIGKLSSGSRITSAKDDAASLSIASGLSLDLASLRAANANISQANSVLQIADGGYGQIGEVLNRMKTLAATASSDQISDTERGFLNTEYQELVSQVDGIATATSYNGVQLIGGGNTLQVNQAVGLGSDVAAADGFVGFEFDPAIRNGDLNADGATTASDGEIVQIEYDKNSNVMTVTVQDNITSGGNTLTVAAQTIDLDDIAGNPFDIGGGNSLDSGETYELNFDQLGIKITLDESFDTTAAIAAGANSILEIDPGTTTVAASLDFVTGVNAANDIIEMDFNGATVADLGLTGTSVLAKDGPTGATTASAAIDSAVNLLNSARSEVGAVLSRLEFAKNTVGVQIENTEAARSTLMDVDVAEEFTNFSSKQVLIQAGVSILSQANQQPQALLRILQ